jgi:glycolate oxidase iron-sulfur subunit
MGWSTRWAPTTTELEACVECGLCLPHCPTYRLTGDEVASPRGRLNAMSAVAIGALDIDADFEEAMGFCLQCRACEAACPSMVPFGRAMEGARAEVVSSRGGRRMRHRILGRWLARPRIVRIATVFAALAQRLGLARLMPRRFRSGLTGMRRLPLRPRSHRGARHPAHGQQVGVAGLLAGCVMDPWFGGVHDAAIDLLTRAGWEVVVPAGQTCCGALAAHDGAADLAAGLAARNVTAFGGVDVVVSDAAGCGAHLAEYRHWADGGDDLGGRSRDITVLVAAAIDAGRLPTLPGGRGPVAIQDPCHLRHAQRVTAEPRRVVAAAGHEVVEIDEVGMCCGAAGIYSVLRPDTSAELGRAKADQVRASAAVTVASANPGCEMQLRTHLGEGYRIRHPVEIYHEALVAAEGGLADG